MNFRAGWSEKSSWGAESPKIDFRVDENWKIIEKSVTTKSSKNPCLRVDLVDLHPTAGNCFFSRKNCSRPGRENAANCRLNALGLAVASWIWDRKIENLGSRENRVLSLRGQGNWRDNPRWWMTARQCRIALYFFRIFYLIIFSRNLDLSLFFWEATKHR